MILDLAFEINEVRRSHNTLKKWNRKKGTTQDECSQTYIMDRRCVATTPRKTVRREPGR